MKLLLRYFCSKRHQENWEIYILSVMPDTWGRNSIASAFWNQMVELFQQTRITHKICIYCGEKLKSARRSTI